MRAVDEAFILKLDKFSTIEIRRNARKCPMIVPFKSI